ncbi:MAG: hypothetical protein LBK82_00280 [Planctomycetaceae bacterium]|jgi:hypothetical protein|nr:hypothetical protein [Planctomycetaceae bacterium]
MKKQKYTVLDSVYYCHTEPDGSSVMEARYYVEIRNGERIRQFSEYLNFEDKNLKNSSVRWWKTCSPDPVPATNQHAVDIANYHGVDIPNEIEVEYTATGYEIINVTVKEKASKLEQLWQMIKNAGINN